MNSKEAPVGPLFMAWMLLTIVLSPAPDINNEGDHQQEIQGKCNSLKIHKMALEPIGHSVIFLGEMQTKFHCQNIRIIIIINKKMFRFLRT